METYIRFTFPVTDQAAREVLIARLSEAGFEGFEEREDALLAFLPQSARSAVDDAALAAIAPSWTEEAIAPQNWNALWESSFEPVVVEDFCAVRAAFHEPVQGVAHEIIITPQMAFGTGHHATTYSMISAIKNLPFRDAQVLDFGTGTGVLAILAAKLGAAAVYGIDNESWAVSNAIENVAANNATVVTIAEGSLEAVPVPVEQYDIILANINRHILLQYMEEMSAMLEQGGTLLLSGILTADEDIIAAAASRAGLSLKGKLERTGWLALTYEKEGVTH